MISPFRIIVSALTVSLFLLPQIAQTTTKASPALKTYSFKIAAHVPWNDTKLDLKRGELIHIYGGLIECDGQRPEDRDSLPLPSAPVGALLAKIHLDDDPVLATPDAELPIMDPSHLYLGVNGKRCTGELSVKVQVKKNPATLPH